MTTSLNLYHQKISIILARYLSAFVGEMALVEVFTAPTDVVFSDTEVLVPDFLFVSNNRKYILEESYVHGASYLFIEILSPSALQK